MKTSRRSLFYTAVISAIVMAISAINSSGFFNSSSNNKVHQASNNRSVNDHDENKQVPNNLILNGRVSEKISDTNLQTEIASSRSRTKISPNPEQAVIQSNPKNHENATNNIGFSFLDPNSEQFKHYRTLYEQTPFKFKVINGGADIIRARMHPRGDLILTHTHAETLNTMVKDKDAFLGRVSDQMHSLNDSFETNGKFAENEERVEEQTKSAAQTADNIAYITERVFPLATALDITIYDYNCASSQCILLANYTRRIDVFTLTKRIENLERYVVAWSYPITQTHTEALFIQFR